MLKILVAVIDNLIFLFQFYSVMLYHILFGKL